jgi:hypothetical protein
MFKYLFTLIFVFTLYAVHSQSQNDSIMVSEEYYQEGDPNLILVRKGRRRATFNETQILMVSLGLQNSGSIFGRNDDGYFSVIDLGYERKIKESPFSVRMSLSYQGGFWGSNVFSYYRNRQISEDELENQSTNVNIQLDLGARYYHRQKKRLSKGGGGNNLNGSYLGFTVWNAVSQVTQRTATVRVIGGRSTLYKETEQETVSLASTLILLNWGNQTRILKRAYLDFNIGPVISLSTIKDWSVVMNLKMGIALWKK